MIVLLHFLSLWWRKIYVNYLKNYWDPKLYSIGGSFFCNQQLIFDPPCYQQRYAAVAAVIEEESLKTHLKKVVDFGCAETSFFLSLKRLKTIEKVLEVDIDEDLLSRLSNKVEPLLVDHLFFKREVALNVKVCCGSVCDYDPILKDTDVVVAIELIEHLHEDILEKVPNNIFGCIRPSLAIFTTPNAEFNVLFPDFSGMRHWDHKFEWTRKQFQDWALSITKSYPEYTFKLFGIGPKPHNTSKDVGCCSQMAVFRLQNPQLGTPTLPAIITSYKIIRDVDYPFYVDNRTPNEKIVQAVRSRIWDVANKHESNVLPLKDFLIYIDEYSQSLQQLREALESANWTIQGPRENPLLVIPRDYYPDSDDFDDENSDCSDNDLAWIADEKDPYADENWDEKVTWDYFQKNNCEEHQKTKCDDYYNEWGDNQYENSWDDNPKIMNPENPKSINEPSLNDENLFTNEISEISLSESFFNQLDMTNNSSADRMSKSLIVESSERSNSDTPKSKRCKRKTDEELTDIYDHKKKMLEAKKDVAGPSGLIETEDKNVGDGSNDWWNGNSVDSSNGSWNGGGEWERDEIVPLRKSDGFNRINKPLAKSCSLDSCLENINCERVEVQAMYLSMHSRARTHDISSPGPDSGYPASTSMDLTDVTSGFPASASALDFTSEDSLSGEEGPPVVAPRLPPLPPPPPVENGDVANNNRDGEGNNVEGMRNPLPPPFAPIEEFPPWLLHLLLEPPVQMHHDEGLGDVDSDASDSPVASIY